MTLRGVFLPIPTPFDRDELDLGALRFNIERWMKTGIAGLVVLGSNGEAPQVDERETDQLVSTARELVPRGRGFIVGTGRESTRATVAATRRAAELGADAALVRTPSFFKSQMTTEAFVRHYLAVADAARVPVILYNYTAVTGVNLDLAAVVSLAEHPNIIGVKESNADIEKVAALASAAPPGFTVLVGSGATFHASLCVGASGGVLALACVVPDACVRLYELAVAQRSEEAQALQRRLAPLGRIVTTEYGVPGLKAALDLAGYIGGNPRPPLLPAPPAGVDRIRQALIALQVVSEELPRA